MKEKRHNIPAINSSASADIAFLLLIFFLLTSSLDTTKGMFRKLPPSNQDNAHKEKIDILKRNILYVSIDEQNKIRCNDELTTINDLKPKLKNFISNPDNDNNLPEKTEMEFQGLGVVPVTIDHVIALEIDRNSDYQTYISVQNELATVYNELRDEFTKQYFHSDFKKSTPEQKEMARQAFPMKIAELEALKEKETEQ